MRKTLNASTAAAVLVLALAGASPSTVHAQSAFPTKPVRVIVPWRSGGPGDTFARLVAKAIEDNKLLPQPVVIINKPGGGTTIGSRAVKDAKPDGYTLLFYHQTVITAKLMGTADYGIEAFQPVAETHNVCIIYGTSQKSGIKDARDFIAKSKAKPGSIKDATLLGSLSHFSAELFNTAAGIKVGYVNVGGGRKRFASVLGNHTQVMIMLPHHVYRPKSGMKGLVYLAPKRHPNLPNVPTAKELGYDVESCVNYWWLTAKGTPADRVATLAAAFKKATELPELRKTLTKRGVNVEFFTGPALKARMTASEKSLTAIAPKLK